jgi:hypothetical protein
MKGEKALSKSAHLWWKSPEYSKGCVAQWVQSERPVWSTFQQKMRKHNISMLRRQANHLPSVCPPASSLSSSPHLVFSRSSQKTPGLMASLFLLTSPLSTVGFQVPGDTGNIFTKCLPKSYKITISTPRHSISSYLSPVTWSLLVTQGFVLGDPTFRLKFLSSYWPKIQLDK